ncbi:hypothetical protein L6269_01465 [Candidatus Dependentiae bacterium]|nr:hypothetical protein [Candidatus Dependentiae bacterium]
MKSNFFKKISLAVLIAFTVNFYTVNAGIIVASHWLNPETGQNVYIYSDKHDIYSDEQTKYLINLLKEKTNSNLIIFIESYILSDKEIETTNNNELKILKETNNVIIQSLKKYFKKQSLLRNLYDLINSSKIQIETCETRGIPFLMGHYIRKYDAVKSNKYNATELNENEYQKLLKTLDLIQETFKEFTLQRILKKFLNFLQKQIKIHESNNELVYLIYTEKNEIEKNAINLFKKYNLSDDNIKKDFYIDLMISKIKINKNYQNFTKEFKSLFNLSVDIKTLINIIDNPKKDIAIFVGAGHGLNIEASLEYLGFKLKKEMNRENLEIIKNKIMTIMTN